MFLVVHLDYHDALFCPSQPSNEGLELGICQESHQKMALFLHKDYPTGPCLAGTKVL